MDVFKISWVSFLISYVILLFLHLVDPGLRNTVMRNGRFQPLIPIQEFFQYAGFSGYWTEPTLAITINIVYWWAAIFGIMYFNEKKKNPEIK